MEIEKAIETLGGLTLCGICTGSENGCTNCDRYNAKILALSALRAQQERENGCEYCTEPEEVTGTKPNSAGIHEYFKLKSGFRLERHYNRTWVLRCEHCDATLLPVTNCPHCGRKLVK